MEKKGKANPEVRRTLPEIKVGMLRGRFLKVVRPRESGVGSD